MRIIENGSNYVVIEDGNGCVLFSYNTPVAAVEAGELLLSKYYHDFSTTTGKHVRRFIENYFDNPKNYTADFRRRLFRGIDDGKKIVYTKDLDAYRIRLVLEKGE